MSDFGKRAPKSAPKSAPESAPESAPRRASPIGYFVAVGAFVAGLALMGLFLNLRLTGLSNELIQVVVPGEITLNLAESGTYTIFHERNSVVDGKLYASQSIDGLAVSVRSEAGAPLIVAPVTASTRYEFSGRIGTGAFQFEVMTPGSYRLLARYADSRRANQAVLAIGRNFVGGLVTTILIAIGIVFASGAIGVLIGVWTYRRNKAAG